MRALRRAITASLPIVGMILVFAAILLPSISLNLQLQILVALIGIILIEAGVWGLTAKVLPSERKFIALRAEVDHFIGLVRELNARAVVLKRKDTPEHQGEFDQALSALHDSVERMGEVAGQESEVG